MSNFRTRTIQNKWGLQWVGIIAIAVLIWWAGPILTIGDSAPLDLVANRLLAILLVVIVWAIYHLVILTRANQTDLNLMAELSLSHEDADKAFAIDNQDDEAAELKDKFQAALRLLKETQSKDKFGQRYLYELPWYVVIGAPGSGKTTLLFNSGIRFPTSEGGRPAVKGIGGTRNCNWLFSDEAIFIDTAGRYTTQDSHQPTDAAAWKRFLELLKKYRPQRPVNGVLFTLSLSDLLTWKAKDVTRYARTLRKRAMELYDILGIPIPIYLLVTKCDLVAGFTEFFEDLDLTHRAQVWGVTFPAHPKAIVKAAPHYLTKLFAALRKKVLARIQKERDLTRRGLVLDFPQQMELLKPLILQFLEETCRAKGHGRRPLLRGVYFTSGTQQGTPIDRVMHHLSKTFELDIPQLPQFSGHVKSFFITRLLRDVILKERELAGLDYSLIRRQNLRNWAVSGLIFGLMTVLMVLWSTGYTRNKTALNRINGLLDQYETFQAEDHPDPLNLLSRLNTVAAAKDVYQERPWYEGGGLYQGQKLEWAIERIYRKLLVNDLYELIKIRLESDLKRYIRTKEEQDHSKLYDLLRLYLMLGMPEKMEAESLQQWSQHDKAHIFPNDPQLQARLQTHLIQLFRLPLDALPLDQGLVMQAKRILVANPLYSRLYTDLKSRFLSDEQYDFYLKDILSAAALSILTTKNGLAPEALRIPGWYTLEGYQAVFGKRGPALVQEALNQNWVLKDAGTNGELDLKQIYLQIQQLYFSDYEHHWKGLLDNLSLKPPEQLSHAIHIADSLSGPESPLKPLLLVLHKNTAASIAAENAAQADASRSASNAPPRSFKDISRYFEELTKLVIPSHDQSTPLDDVIDQLIRLRDALLKNKITDSRGIVNESRQEFEQLPEPLKGWLLPLTTFQLD